MKYLVSKPDTTLKASIVLPASKSVANRALIIHALSNSPFPIENLPDSDDTRVLKQVLDSNDNRFDIGHAGTAMRFLTAYLSQIVGEWIITGSDRMKQRPIAILVDALTKLGAKIEYIEKEGFPPLRIFGTHLKGCILELDGSVSSQYISALLMIAPTLESGLTLRLKGKITSRPYIDMTLRLMAQFGVEHVWKGNEIYIAEQHYKAMPFSVEADWSAASYWYELAVLADEPDLELVGLHTESLQGDAVLAKWFEQLGIGTQKTQHGSKLVKLPLPLPTHLQLNFIENPDVAQTFAVLCVLKKIPFHFKGLETLKIKETNRIAALQDELAKLGARLTEPAEGELKWDGTFPLLKQEAPEFETYHDHRMALAFAPACMAIGVVTINDPMVVTKSYPGYWDDLKKASFKVEIQE